MKEKRHAQGNDGGPLLPEAQGEAREVERGGNLPVEHGIEPSNGQTPEVQISQSTRAQIGKPAYITFTEDSAKQALVEARGDIFIASQLLGVTAIRLDRAIQVSPILQESLATIKEIGKGVSDSTIHAAIERRLVLYRVAGLDALHDLATMPINENSAQNQVKLSAAARLSGGLESAGSEGEMAETFRELSELYQKHAPRLRVIREKTTVELSVPDERVISSQEPPE